MEQAKLAWVAASVLLAIVACTESACTQAHEPEPAPFGNGSNGSTAAGAPAQRLDSTDPMSDTSGTGDVADPAPTPSDLPASRDAGAADARTAKDVAACVAACEAKYPGGTDKSKMIDQCWADHCSACQTMKPGSFYTPTSGACQAGVYTWSADCSQCTTDWCCWAWDMCFSDAECKALNACTVACTK
jgi:hypothetical protein